MSFGGLNSEELKVKELKFEKPFEFLGSPPAGNSRRSGMLHLCRLTATQDRVVLVCDK